MENALTAKICCFGSATVLKIDPSHQQQLPAFPGTLPGILAFSAEAMADDPNHSEKLDSLSIGVLTVEI